MAVSFNSKGSYYCTSKSRPSDEAGIFYINYLAEKQQFLTTIEGELVGN